MKYFLPLKSHDHIQNNTNHTVVHLEKLSPKRTLKTEELCEL